MKNIDAKKVLTIFTLCILLIIPFLRILSFYLQYYNVINDYDSINIAIILYISIPFLLYTYVYNIIRTKKLNYYDYIFFLFILIGILVCMFSINKNISIFGKDYRHGGFLTLFTYFLLVVNWIRYGNKLDISRFIKLLIIISVINSIYALFQIYTPFNFIIRYGLDTNMACGILGNPNFFGSYIVTVLSIVTYEYLIENKKNISLIILFFISLVNCQSTGPLLTYVLIYILMLILCFNKIKVKKYLKLLFILIVTCVMTLSLNYLLVDVFKVNIKNNSTFRCEICDIKKNSKSIDNGRIDIWKNSLKIVKKYPVLGVGYDNLYLAYPNKPKESVVFSITNSAVSKNDLRGNVIVDNTHNMYLNALVSSGILGVIPFIILLAITFFKGLNQRNKVLLFAFIAFSIQGFANINMITTTPIYFIIIGFILSAECQN